MRPPQELLLVLSAILLVGCIESPAHRWEAAPAATPCHDIVIGFWGQWDAMCYDPRQNLEREGDDWVCRCNDKARNHDKK